MKFRVFIMQDPHAESRGFSIKGIKVPLRTWCPIDFDDDMASFDGKKLKKGRYTQFWKLSCDDLITSRPSLEKHLKRVDWLLVPLEFCDVSPIERWEEAWSSLDENLKLR